MRILALLLGIALFPVMAGYAAGVLDSPHNLSAGSLAAIKATEETRVCIFCHTPHHATILSDPSYPGPLWSRQENANEYTLYQSPTIQGLPGQPQGASRLCLSCHDGTIALGSPSALGTSAVLPTLSGRRSSLGLDLSDDHPISMEYGARPEEFNDADTLLSHRVRLSRNQYVECTSCHDPHDNQFGKFVVMDLSAQSDGLCTVCHAKSGWLGSAHQTGGTRTTAALTDEVSRNGCINCHLSHAAHQGPSLLRLADAGAGLDSNCLAACHNGTGSYSALANIAEQFNPARYTHPLDYDSGANLHEANEALPLSRDRKHVHCIDCHNPHQSRWEDAPLTVANAPEVNGVLRGVRGVTLGGAVADQAAYEYQICFRCHSGIDAIYFSEPIRKVTRLFESVDPADLAKRFDPASAPSFHPVAAQRTGDGRSLLPGANTLSIYCANCHHPHGADEPYMLRAANPQTFPNFEGTTFPLCYSCHNENYLLNLSASAMLHANHVLGHHPSGNSDPVPCSACHDPHGVPYVAGRTSSDNSLHLVNFDRRYVPADAAYSAGPSPSCLNLQGAGTVRACHPSSVANPASY